MMTGQLVGLSKPSICTDFLPKIADLSHVKDIYNVLTLVWNTSQEFVRNSPNKKGAIDQLNGLYGEYFSKDNPFSFINPQPFRLKNNGSGLEISDRLRVKILNSPLNQGNAFLDAVLALYRKET